MPTKESIETNTVSTANSKKKSNQSKRKQKLEKSTCPKRDGLITSYFEPIEKSESQKKIDMMIRISELENRVKKLENEKLQLTKEISNLTKKNTELSQKYETGKRNTNVGKSTNSPDTFQKRSGKPQKRRGQTNVDKVKIDDNKMKVEVKENEVRTKNNEKGFIYVYGPSFSPYNPLQNVRFERSVTCSFFQELHSHVNKNSDEKV